MVVKPLEVFTEGSNYGIVRMPGRSYPGCVVQGDSLYILGKTAKRILDGVRSGATHNEEFRGDVQELHDSLLDRLLHYQRVLQHEGLDLPYIRPIEAEAGGASGQEDERQ